MMQTVEAIVDENGKVKLLETVRLPEARRALLTILEDSPPENSFNSNKSLSEKWADNKEFLSAVNDAYLDEDAEEKEFLRLMKNKQTDVLDGWK